MAGLAFRIGSGRQLCEVREQRLCILLPHVVPRRHHAAAFVNAGKNRRPSFASLGAGRLVRRRLVLVSKTLSHRLE